jgi:hypothetical protein
MHRFDILRIVQASGSAFGKTIFFETGSKAEVDPCPLMHKLWKDLEDCRILRTALPCCCLAGCFAEPIQVRAPTSRVQITLTRIFVQYDHGNLN